MFCQFLLYSIVTQSYIYILFLILSPIFYHVPSQVIGCSFLDYTGRPYCLSILNIIVCIYYPKLPVHPPPFFFLLAGTSLFSMSVKTSILNTAVWSSLWPLIGPAYSCLRIFAEAVGSAQDASQPSFPHPFTKVIIIFQKAAQVSHPQGSPFPDHTGWDKSPAMLKQ